MQHANFQVVTAPPSAQIVTGPPTNVQTISDDELIEILRATGHDVGLIRTGQRVILTDNRPDRPEPSSRLDSGHAPAVGDPAV
jgi:hypothetical protein